MGKKLIGSVGLTDTGVPDDLLTTKGDMHGFSSTNARIPISTNNFSLLCASGESLGLKWGASATSILSAAGDILYASGANTLARLAKGDNDQVLTLKSGVPSWETAGGGGVSASWITGDFGADNDSGNADVFLPMGFGREAGARTTESDVSNEINTAVTLTRHVDRCECNEKNSATVSSFRDDGSDVGALSITASTTGLFDTGAISVSIVAGSLCDWHFDTSSSNAGSLNLKCIAEFS